MIGGAQILAASTFLPTNPATWEILYNFFIVVC
jgi:hypothetical protein